MIRPEIKTPLPGPKAEAQLKQGAKVLSTSYVRPYPFVADRGEGVWLFDVDGNRFLDFFAGIAVNTTGYGHPRVLAAVEAQAKKLQHVCFSDFSHEPTLSLAERLVDRLGGGYRVYFGNSGTEAVEAAMKLARYHTRRPYFLAFLGAFHGRTYGSLSLTNSSARYREGFAPLVPGVVHVPFPSPTDPPFGVAPERAAEAVLDHLDHLFKTKLPPSEVAAFFVEPIQGEGGYRFPAPGFFQALKEKLDRHGILLVADEIQTGAGRTGTFLAMEQEGVTPDVVLLAKGLASGYPLSAVLFRAELSSWPPGAHGTTFGGHPVAAAAAHATLDLLESGLMENAARVGALLLEKLKSGLEGTPGVREVRGRGLLLAIEYEDQQTRDAAVRRTFEKGVLTLGAGARAQRITPPLVLNEAEAELGAALIVEAVREVSPGA